MIYILTLLGRQFGIGLTTDSTSPLVTQGCVCPHHGILNLKISLVGSGAVSLDADDMLQPILFYTLHQLFGELAGCQQGTIE